MVEELRALQSILEKRESQEQGLPWDKVRELILQRIVEFSTVKAFILPTLKACHNDWMIWIDRVFLQIAFKEYSVAKLHEAIKKNRELFPSRWMEVDFTQSVKDVRKQLLQFSRQNNIPSSDMKSYKNQLIPKQQPKKNKNNKKRLTAKPSVRRKTS